MSTDSLAPKFNSRRNFLRTGVTATLATATYPALGSARVVDPFAPAPACAGRDFKQDFELDEITIDDLQKAFQSGQYSSRSLTEKYLARIQEIDKAAPGSTPSSNSTPMLSRLPTRSTRSARRRGRAGRCMAFRS